MNQYEYNKKGVLSLKKSENVASVSKILYLSHNLRGRKDLCIFSFPIKNKGSITSSFP